MTDPINQRIAVIETLKEARKLLSEHDLMQKFGLAQLDRAYHAFSDLEKRGKVSPLTRPTRRTRRGRPELDSEEVLLVAAARALCLIYAEHFKVMTSHTDVAEMLHFRGYRLRNGARISAVTIRGWMKAKNPRVLTLTEQIRALGEKESPGEQAREILRFIGMRVTRSVPPYQKSP
jgi:hypothetical protein